MTNEHYLQPESKIENVLPLHDQLVNERNDIMLEKAVRLAARVAEDVISDPARVITSDEWSGDIMFGNVDMASSRIQLDLINSAASKKGLAVLEGDSFSVGEGPRVIWDISDSGALSLRYSDPGGLMREQIREDRSEAIKPFERLALQLQEGALEARTDIEYALDLDQQDEVFCFMEINPRQTNPVKAKQVFIERLYGLPVHLTGEEIDPQHSGEGVYFDEDGNLLKILRETDRNSGIYRGMYFEQGTKTDPSETTFQLGVEIDRERALLEKSHNGELSEISFLESNTGRSIIQEIDNSGLVITDSLRQILESISTPQGAYDSRYGNNYSELTREVAKMIGNSNRGIGRFFDDSDGDAEKKLSSINVDTIDNEPARLLYSLMQQSISPNRNTEASDIPVFNGRVHMKDSSCKDAEVYFSGSIGEGKFSVHDVGGKKMLHKHSGGATAINLEPIMYKGVEIPAGGLFQRHYDNESETTSYVFVRITSFAFEDDQARDAFTWQYAENTRNRVTPSASVIKKFR